MHFFDFNGGSFKPNEHATCKFFLFALLEDEETIFYDAVKRKIFDRAGPAEGSDGSSGSYQSLIREVKLFVRSQGFGVESTYYSFFFRMGGESNRIITVTPFPDRRDYFFRAKGRFLSNDEIKKRFDGTDTYRFYKKQKYLSKGELRDIIHIEGEESLASPGKVRFVRV